MMNEEERFSSKLCVRRQWMNIRWWRWNYDAWRFKKDSIILFTLFTIDIVFIFFVVMIEWWNGKVKGAVGWNLCGDVRLKWAKLKYFNWTSIEYKVQLENFLSKNPQAIIYFCIIEILQFIFVILHWFGGEIILSELKISYNLIEIFGCYNNNHWYVWSGEWKFQIDFLCAIYRQVHCEIVIRSKKKLCFLSR